MLPGSALPEISWSAAFAADKWVHAILYFLWMWVYAHSGGTHFFRAAVWMLIFGGLIELFQQWILSDRSGEWLDWAADAVGLVVGLIWQRLFFKS